MNEKQKKMRMNKNFRNFVNGSGSYDDPYIIEILNKKNNIGEFDDVFDHSFHTKRIFFLKNFVIGIIYLLFFFSSFVIIPSLIFLIWE